MASNPQYKILYIPVLKVISRHWFARLPLPQASMLLFVNERTLRFGKLSETFTMRAAMSGIVDQKGGAVIHRGTGLGKTAAINALVGLENAGLIIQDIPTNGAHNGRKVTIIVDKVMEHAEEYDISAPRKRLTRRSK